ncbi:non-ribosomal peptide synthetase, partial [Bacillus thuringiensis]|uniref:non-ribosomal peptide synthetase n=1 Tax=Bacillus thuringiensis TaxID=1428 RepID=UPI003A8ABD38
MTLLNNKNTGGTYAYPLSFNQQRLWFLQKLNPEMTAYNLPFALKMKGKLNISVLKNSIKMIIGRHEIFRTVFKEVNNTPAQIILPYQDLNFHVINLEDFSKEEQEKEIVRLINNESNRIFNLANGPLYAFCIVRLSENNHIFIGNIHHIIFDRWSYNVFFKELTSIYEKQLLNKKDCLSDLPIQYIDYSIWQREMAKDTGTNRQLNYWREKLSGELPTLELPTDYRRPANLTYEGNYHTFQIPEEKLILLQKFSQNEGSTLYMTMLTIFKILLNKYTGQSDIIVGSPVAGRDREELENLIGFFVNTLILRTNLDDNKSFRDSLCQVQTTCIEAFRNQDIQFERIVEEINPNRRMGYNPIFQVMFTFQNTPDEAINMYGLQIEPIEIELDNAKFDLSLYFEEKEDVMVGKIQYNSRLFSADKIKAFSLHFQNLLDQILGDFDIEIAKLSVLNDIEKKNMSENLKTIRTHSNEKCFHNLFEEQVEKTPNEIAIEEKSGFTSYRELNNKANQLSRYLRKLGVTTETPVILYLGRTSNMMKGIMGVLKAGGVYIPIDASANKERLLYILEDSKAKFIVSESHLVADLPESSIEVICLDKINEELDRYNTNNPVSKVACNNLAYIIYTSGSTGKPKGVMIQHRGLTNYLIWCVERFKLSEGIGSIIHSSLSFDLPITGLFPPLLTGKKIILLPESAGVEELADCINENKNISILKLTPSHLRMLNNYKIQYSIKNLVIGGETLYEEDINKWRELSPETKIFNHYGPTETVVGACAHEVNGFML